MCPIMSHTCTGAKFYESWEGGEGANDSDAMHLHNSCAKKLAPPLNKSKQTSQILLLSLLLQIISCFFVLVDCVRGNA